MGLKMILNRKIIKVISVTLKRKAQLEQKIISISKLFNHYNTNSKLKLIMKLPTNRKKKNLKHKH